MPAGTHRWLSYAAAPAPKKGVAADDQSGGLYEQAAPHYRGGSGRRGYIARREYVSLVQAEPVFGIRYSFREPLDAGGEDARERRACRSAARDHARGICGAGTLGRARRV